MGESTTTDSRTPVCPVAYGQLPYSLESDYLSLISSGEDTKGRVEVKVVNVGNTSRGLGSATGMQEGN